MWQKRSAECVSEAVTQGGLRRSLSATGPASVLSVSYLYDDYGINDNDYGKMIITCTCIINDDGFPADFHLPYSYHTTIEGES